MDKQLPATDRRRHKESTGGRAAQALLYFFLLLTALTCVVPFVHVIAKSFSADAYVLAGRVFLWPIGVTAEAYGKIFADASILRSLWNSVVVTVAFSAVGMFITVCAGYALTRPQLKGRRALNFLCIFTLYFSGGIIPEYILISSLGMMPPEKYSVKIHRKFSARRPFN